MPSSAGSWYRHPIIRSFDLTAGSLPSGVSFARAAGTAASETVQTGTHTVVATGFTANVPRFGRRLDADPVGLVIEQAATNLWPQARTNNLTAGLDISGGGYVTGKASPDGTTNGVEIQVSSGNLANYFQEGVITGTRILSVWQLKGPGTGAYQMLIGPSFSAGAASAGTAGAAYARIITGPYTYVGTGSGVSPQDGRTVTCPGGVAAGSRDSVVDLVQYEAGFWASEAIVTAGASATRAGERLFLASAVPYVPAGRLSLAISLRPKAAPASYSVAMRLWTSGADYAEIATTGVLTVSIGGVTNTTAAIAWAQYDSLRIFVASGGNLATVVSYSVNGGATVRPAIAGAVLGAVSTAGSLDLLCNGTASQFSAWVTGITFYKNTAKPVWS